MRRCTVLSTHGHSQRGGVLSVVLVGVVVVSAYALENDDEF